MRDEYSQLLLSNNEIGDGGAEEIALALAGDKAHVTVLDFRHNKIGVTGAEVRRPNTVIQSTELLAGHFMIAPSMNFVQLPQRDNRWPLATHLACRLAPRPPTHPLRSSLRSSPRST